MEAAAPGSEALDVTDLRVVPGYVDLQCNGGFGIDLAREPERLWELAGLLPRLGVTAWLPTVVTNGNGAIDRALATLTAGPPDGWTGAHPLGQLPELGDEGVIVLAQPHVDGGADLRWVAPDGAAVVGQHRTLVGDGLRRHEGHVPPVGVLGGDPQRSLLAAAPDPDRELGLDRLGLAAGLGELHVGAVEVRHLLAQQPADRLDGLLEEIQALAGVPHFETAVASVKDKVPLLVVTRSEKGAIAVSGEERAEVGAEPVAAVDERSKCCETLAQVPIVVQRFDQKLAQALVARRKIAKLQLTL